MPTAPPRVCSKCKSYFTSKKCTKCERQRQQLVNRKRDPKKKRIYDSASWEALRNQKLARNPFCEYMRGNGIKCGALAEHVDHIESISSGGAELPPLEELRSLCISHHSRKTVLEDGGFGRKCHPVD